MPLSIAITGSASGLVDVIYTMGIASAKRHEFRPTFQRNAITHMCMKCDGYSDEQIAQWLELTILTHGWALQGVLPSDSDDHADSADADAVVGGWTYTVGATESYGVPELIITDVEFELAGPILNWAVEFLRDGGTLDGLVDDQILWAPVHDDHLSTGWFLSYIDHYGEPPKPGGVIQLFPSIPFHSAECVKRRCVDLSSPNESPRDRRGSWE